MTLGMLVAASGGRAGFQYAFTPADVVWLGRLLAVAASGPYRGRLRAILWRSLARFASNGRRGLPLAAFIQQLEPSLPRVPWAQLPLRARQLALAAGRGRLRRGHPNALVQVVPHGGLSPRGYGAGYGYGSPGSYGWSRESELTEAAPPGDAPPPGPPAPPMATPPPVDAAQGADDAMAPADDLPADDAAVEPPMPDEPLPAPASFDTMDGNRLDVNPQWMRALMRSWRRRRAGWWRGQPASPYSRYQPWRAPFVRTAGMGAWAGRPFARAPFGATRVLAARLQRLARGARRVGTLRAVGSGRRYPVFGGRIAGRNYRIITRPRGGLRHEIMAGRGSELQQELAG